MMNKKRLQKGQKRQKRVFAFFVLFAFFAAPSHSKIERLIEMRGFPNKFSRVGN